MIEWKHREHLGIKELNLSEETNINLGKINNEFVNSKSYKNQKNIIVAVCFLFMLVYAFRNNLYELNNHHVTLLAGTTPNFFASSLFT